MGNRVRNRFTTIEYRGVAYRALQCGSCGAKIWPIKTFKYHMLRHSQKEKAFQDYMEPIRRTMRGLRNNWGLD